MHESNQHSHSPENNNYYWYTSGWFLLFVFFFWNGIIIVSAAFCCLFVFVCSIILSAKKTPSGIGSWLVFCHVAFRNAKYSSGAIYKETAKVSFSLSLSLFKFQILKHVHCETVLYYYLFFLSIENKERTLGFYDWVLSAKWNMMQNHIHFLLLFLLHIIQLWLIFLLLQ